MSVVIGSNISALRAQRSLSQSTTATEDIYSRLSSGQRINTASDDPAGLAVGSQLQSAVRIYSQAVRNVNDGISLLNIAEGALTELSKICMRQPELATQSANDTYSAAQRKSMDSEANALVDEYNRILATTTFNGSNVFDSSKDGIQLQVGSGSNSTLSINLGVSLSKTIGDGTFQAQTCYRVGSADNSDPCVPLAVDIDGDGNLDLIDPIEYNNGVSILYGKGDGTFQPAVSLTFSGNNPRAISAVDLNGDNRLDLVVANGVNNVTVYKNNGNRSFSAKAQFTTGYGPNNPVIFDVDGNGKLDIVTSNSGTNDVSVLFGNGNGTFKAPVCYTVGIKPKDLTAIDLNGDGKLDLVANNVTSNNLSVLINKGDGTFCAQVCYALGGSPDGPVTVVDLNGDGKLDLVSSNTGTNNVSVLLGKGDGTFSSQVCYTVGASPSAWVTAADLNNDGKLDLITANKGSNNTSVLYGKGDGTFEAQVCYKVGTYPDSKVDVYDLNGDGNLDMVVGNTYDRSIGVLLGNGDKTFKAQVTYQVGLYPKSPVINDFNKDGINDIAVANWGGYDISVLLGNAISVKTMSRLNLLTRSDALKSMSTINDISSRVINELGTIGSFQSRLVAAAKNLSIMSLEYKSAESRIMDADIAEESSGLLRQQILQKLGCSVLAQANQAPALALKLLSS